MDSREDFQARLSMQALFVSKVTDLVGDRLDGFGVFFSPADAVPVIVRWVVSEAKDAGLSVDDYVVKAEETIDEVVETITGMLLLEIAEERPGNDPWEYEWTIPIPVSVAALMVHMLTMCANLAFSNNADSWTQNAMSSCGSMSAVLAEHFIKEEQAEGRMKVLMRNGHREVNGPIIKMPQPALAYLARFFESAADRIEKGLWTIHDLEIVSKEEVAENVRHEAAVLRDLCLRFGKAPGPQIDS